MGDKPLEYCCVCGEPTGRAGRGDDSIYRIAAQHFCTSPNGVSGNVVAGEEIGPLCPGCNETLTNLGFLEAE